MSRLSNATQEFQALSVPHQKKTGMTVAGFLFILMDAVLLANFVRLMTRIKHPVPMSWPEVVLLVALGILGIAMIDGEGLAGISQVITAWKGNGGGLFSKFLPPWGKKGAK